MSRYLDDLARADGCREHDHCLTCPLPACVFDGYNPAAVAVQRHAAERFPEAA